MALTEANAHCASMAKEFMTLSTRRLEDVGGGPFEVTFRCLNKNDPELQRPNLQREPDTVIQVK